MCNTITITLSNQSFHEQFSCLFSLFDEQVAYVAVEVLLILLVIWIILKETKPEHLTDLNLSEEEALISEYTPESLVPQVSPDHQALNPRVIQGKIGLNVAINGVESLNFASHDYLGFVGNKVIENATKKCIDNYGVGSCGPRGFYGSTIHHLTLEKSLAEFLGTEDSIILSYGFATIASAIPAYAKKNDIVFVDEKCNFTIQQGLRASKSEIKYFKHNDMQDLQLILEKTRVLDSLNIKKARKSRRHLIVEGIYYNTGEICDLPNIIRLCKIYKLRIFIDESISFGVLGKTGRGVTEYFGIQRKDVDLMMGSFEFTFASIGGFCAGSRFLVDHLQAAAVGYMFSASLPPLLIVACIKALDVIKTHPEILVELKIVCNLMYEKLTASTVINGHFTITGDRDSPVRTLTLNRYDDYENEVIDKILEFCLKQNVVISRTACVDSDIALTRPCLRITTIVNHTVEHILYLVSTLEEACNHVFNR